MLIACRPIVDKVVTGEIVLCIITKDWVDRNQPRPLTAMFWLAWPDINITGGWETDQSRPGCRVRWSRRGGGFSQVHMDPGNINEAVLQRVFAS